MVTAALFSVGIWLSAKLGESLGQLIGWIFFRKIWINVAIALYITGCGVDDSLEKKKETPTTNVSAPDSGLPSSNHEEISVAPQEWPEALLVSTKDELPVCSEKNKRQLVYVQELEQFQSCSGKEWAVVTVGATQARAKDGANGKDGKDGKDGAAAPYVGPDEWIEPVTGQKFLLGGAFNRTQHATCPTGTYFPSQVTLSAAIQAGFFERFTSYAAANNQQLWLGDGKLLYIGSSMVARTGSIENYTWGSDPNAGTTYHRTLCVK